MENPCPHCKKLFKGLSWHIPKCPSKMGSHAADHNPTSAPIDTSSSNSGLLHCTICNKCSTDSERALSVHAGSCSRKNKASVLRMTEASVQRKGSLPVRACCNAESLPCHSDGGKQMQLNGLAGCDEILDVPGDVEVPLEAEFGGDHADDPHVDHECAGPDDCDEFMEGPGDANVGGECGGNFGSGDWDAASPD